MKGNLLFNVRWMSMKRAMLPIQARHPQLFKDDTYEFEAIKELVMCMLFDFIDGLKDKKWTHIDKKCLNRLMKHLKKAQSSNIKQFRFIRHIGSHDIKDNSESMRLKMIATYMKSF
jgi:hypothetical protein